MYIYDIVNSPLNSNSIKSAYHLVHFKICLCGPLYSTGRLSFLKNFLKNCLPFDPLHPFLLPLPPTTPGNHQFILCIYEVGFLFVCCQSQYLGEIDLLISQEKIKTYVLI